jgi:hypothetical protein
MAGTTGLEPADSAVTVSGLQVLSTTWKSTDGTRSHWKYVVDNAIVYRDVYRVFPSLTEETVSQTVRTMTVYVVPRTIVSGLPKITG